MKLFYSLTSLLNVVSFVFTRITNQNVLILLVSVKVNGLLNVFGPVLQFYVLEDLTPNTLKYLHVRLATNTLK